MLNHGSTIGTLLRRAFATCLVAMVLVAGTLHVSDAAVAVPHPVTGTCSAALELDAPDDVAVAGTKGEREEGAVVQSHLMMHSSHCPSNCPLDRTAVVEPGAGAAGKATVFGQSGPVMLTGIVHSAQPKPPRLVL